MYGHVSLIIYQTLSIFLRYSFEPFRFLNPIVLVLACRILTLYRDGQMLRSEMVT